jgi:hypothetical protein
LAPVALLNEPASQGVMLELPLGQYVPLSQIAATVVAAFAQT